jgi:hypothetical protein
MRQEWSRIFKWSTKVRWWISVITNWSKINPEITILKKECKILINARLFDKAKFVETKIRDWSENQLKQKTSYEKKYNRNLQLLKQAHVKKREVITAHFNELIFTKKLSYKKELSIIDFNTKKELESKKNFIKMIENSTN